MAAIKQILDRTEGTPIQKQEVTHKYAELKDEELDAIINSEFEDLNRMSSIDMEQDDVH